MVRVTWSMTALEIVDVHGSFVSGTPAIVGAAEDLSLAWTSADGWQVVYMVPRA